MPIPQNKQCRIKINTRTILPFFAIFLLAITLLIFIFSNHWLTEKHDLKLITLKIYELESNQSFRNIKIHNGSLTAFVHNNSNLSISEIDLYILDESNVRRIKVNIPPLSVHKIDIPNALPINSSTNSNILYGDLIIAVPHGSTVAEIVNIR